MKRIGLTGGMGMGKSRAAGWLREQAIPVLDTDDLARELTAPGQPALELIRAEFGGDIITPAGELNRAVLAKLIFGDTGRRQRLEAILHPRIRRAWQRRLDEWEAEGRPVAVVVIPLLYETGAETALAPVVCLACSAQVQVERLRTRGWSDDQIQARESAQWPVREKMNRADYVIWNDGDVEVLSAQLQRIPDWFSGGLDGATPKP